MKLLIIFFVILSTALIKPQDYPYSEEDEKPIGISLTGTLKVANTITLSRGFENREINTVPGYAFGIEYYILKDENRNGGAGFEYQFPNEVYGLDGSFQNLPVYMFYEFSIIRVKYIVLPYIHLQLGYNFLLIDDFIDPDFSSGNGLFYGLGFSSGITNYLRARLTFSSNLGKINDSEGSWFFSNNKINITLALVL